MRCRAGGPTRPHQRVGTECGTAREKERQLLERLASSAAAERAKGYSTNVDPRDVSWVLGVHKRVLATTYVVVPRVGRGRGPSSQLSFFEGLTRTFVNALNLLLLYLSLPTCTYRSPSEGA